MDNHGKQNVSVGPHTFPLEDIDKKILIEAFKLFDSASYPDSLEGSFIDESWWKELDNTLRLYGKKGMGFYYGYMMYLNQNKSGEELRNGDINPVVAPGFSVGAQVGSGTHRVGELDGVQMIELEGVFGNATYEGSQDGKTQMEWAIGFDDMGGMKVGPTFIYDYKQYNTEPDEIEYWSVGGSNNENLLAVLLSLYRKYGESLIDMIKSNMLYEEIDTEIKYAVDQQYRNDPEQRKEVLDSLEFDPYEDRDFYVGGYKELQFDVEPRMLIDKLAQKKGYGRVVDEMLGGNGTAYFTSKGNVIKLTGDKSEYETANVIKGKQNKYIADVFESGKLDSSHIVSGDGYIIIMEELGLPKTVSETFEECCCGVNKPIHIEHDKTPAVIHPPVDGSEECKKIHNNLLMIRQELTQHGISWSDIGIDNLGMKNGKLALLDLGETTGGIDTGQTIELNESGANTSWSNDEDKITLQHILDLTEHIKAVDYPTEELSPIVLGWKDNPEEIERINQVEVSKQYPILIMVTKDDKLLWILDGNHRAQQALKNNIPTIPAKLIKPSDLDERSIKMFFPKGIPSAKQTIELNEREQLELELPTPIGEFEFPVGYEDYTVDGKLYDGDEQESVDVIKDAVSNEAVTYLFKKWDKSGISFEDLKLLGIPTNNSLTRTMLVKRYLKNTYKNIPVYHEFDCDDLADMFIKNPRDYSTDYIQKYLCADDSWMDYDGWYDTDWYDGMEDGLDEQNWETIVKILKVPNKEIADNLINDRPQNEEEERMVNELEEEISEIKNSIVWGHNDESEYATKNAMAEDITDKLAEHFEGDGKLIQDDNGMFSWRIEGNLLDYLEDDMWDNTEVFQHHPDYAGATLEDWLQDLTHELPESIFQALMLEEFTFLDYDYGKRGDMLEPETKWFDGYYHPDYDINQAVFDRLREVEYEFSSNSPEQLDEEVDFYGNPKSRQSDAFDTGELVILKHIHKNFTKQNLKQLTDETPLYGETSNKWSKLMKMFGIPTRSMEQMATSTQYAKYALDNWNEEGDYTMEYPKRNMIGWWDVSRDETGSQIEYKSGGTDVLAFNSDDAEERGDNEFHDWDGDMETVDWGDYEAYDSEIREVEPTGDYPEIPKISEGVAGDQEKHTGEQGGFFTLDGSDNIGNTDIFRDDGFDIIHQHRGNVHLSDISPEESETAIPQGSKKVKKTVLKPRLDKGPFNIPIPMKEHYEDIESNPDLNPEVEEGDVIELLYMDDPYSIPIKTKGVVMGFEGKPGDFAYKILVNWIMGPDNLTPMALLPEADIYRFPKKKDNTKDLHDYLNEQWEKPYNDPKAIVNGKEIDLEVADTEFLKQKGMMYKTSYPRNRGMLFLWDDIVPISMWMKNTYLPLDIIYMVDGEVVDYDKDVQPCDKQQCETYGDVNANQVIELLSGGVDNYNISIGDQIELMDV